MNNHQLTKGVVAAALQTALLASCCVLAITIAPAQPIASTYQPSHPTLPEAPFIPLSQSVEDAPAPFTLTSSHFPEPSLYILGTEVRRFAIKCIRSGGNFYYHGGSICLHLTT